METFDSILASVVKPKPNTWFITITIDPKLFVKTAKQQFEITYPPMIKILDRFSYDYSYVTELTEHANVHYHCWLEFKNINTKYRFINAFKESKHLGFIKVNKEPIIETERTYAYMIDAENKKQGKNLAAAYDLIRKYEIAGSKDKFNEIKIKCIEKNKSLGIIYGQDLDTKRETREESDKEVLSGEYF